MNEEPKVNFHKQSKWAALPYWTIFVRFYSIETGHIGKDSGAAALNGRASSENVTLVKSNCARDASEDCVSNAKQMHVTSPLNLRLHARLLTLISGLCPFLLQNHCQLKKRMLLLQLQFSRVHLSGRVSVLRSCFEPCLSWYCPGYILRFNTQYRIGMLGRCGHATGAMGFRLRKSLQSYKPQLPRLSFNSLADIWTFYLHCTFWKGSWPVIWSFQTLLLSRGAELFSLADRHHRVCSCLSQPPALKTTPGLRHQDLCFCHDVMPGFWRNVGASIHVTNYSWAWIQASSPASETFGKLLLSSTITASFKAPHCVCTNFFIV